MESVQKFIKMTVIGGVWFLLPIALVVILGAKLLALARPIVGPFARMVPQHVVAGYALGSMLAALLLVLVAFVAGLLARTEMGRQVVSWIENSLLGVLPQFRDVKNIASLSAQQAFKPVFVSTSGGWRFGLLADRLEGGWVAVFLPNAPRTMTGMVLFVPDALVRPAGVTLNEMMALTRELGVGASTVLKTVEFASLRAVSDPAAGGARG